VYGTRAEVSEIEVTYDQALYLLDHWRCPEYDCDPLADVNTTCVCNYASKVHTIKLLYITIVTYIDYLS
jgi:hypothetical protein